MTDETFEETMCEHGCPGECSICDDLATERSTPFVAPTFVAGQQVTAHIPGDAILEPYTGPAMVIDHTGSLVRLQMEGFVPAHRVYNPESGTHGPGWLDSPIVALDPQNIRPPAQATWLVRPRQRQLEPHTLVLEGYDDAGTLRQRVELGIPPGQRELDWVKLTAANGQRTELRVVPPIAILRMPLEYAVWEPIL